MQGVAVAPAINDENSAAAPHGAGRLKEQQAQGGSALKPAGRRAFGNITNAQPRAGGGGDGVGGGGKGGDGVQAPGTAKRRAFGDITNSCVKQQQQQQGNGGGGCSGSSAAKPQVQQQLLLKPGGARAAPAPWWETAEPERPAGKVWEQLLAEREAAEDDEVERSVAQLLAGMRGLTARCLQVHDDCSSDNGDGAADALVRPLEPPPPLTASPAASPPPSPRNDDGGAFALSWGVGGSLADLLPDVELPPDDSEQAAGEPAAVDLAEAAGGDGSSPVCARSAGAEAARLPRSPEALPW